MRTRREFSKLRAGAALNTFREARKQPFYARLAIRFKFADRVTDLIDERRDGGIHGLLHWRADILAEAREKFLAVDHFQFRKLRVQRSNHLQRHPLWCEIFELCFKSPAKIRQSGFNANVEKAESERQHDRRS